MAQETSENREKTLDGVEKAVIREDILQNFPRLFGTKTVNGRKVNVEQEIAAIAKELHPEIAAALTARRTLLNSPETVREKYAWPKWDDTFEDPVTKALHVSPDHPGLD
jgi:malate synthase